MPSKLNKTDVTQGVFFKAGAAAEVRATVYGTMEPTASPSSSPPPSPAR